MTVEKLSDEPLLGEDGGHLVEVARWVLTESAAFDHEYVDPEEYDAVEDLGQSQAIYWREILYRAHWAAFAALLRSVRWADGVVLAGGADNFLAYSASLRGLIESGADTWYTFRGVNRTISEDCGLIRLALDGEATQFTVNGPLEDCLIHFLYARRVDKDAREQAPDSHKAEWMTTYLSAFDEKFMIRRCYSELCQLTHPALAGIHAYTKQFDEGPRYRVKFWKDADRSRIESFSSQFGAAVDQALRTSVNPALATLKLLNWFDHDPIRTEVVESLDLSEIPLWREITEVLGNRTPAPPEG